MRRVYFTIMLFIFSCNVVFAQEIELVQTVNDPNAWKTQRPRHEVQFGVGDPVIYNLAFLDNYYYFDSYYNDWFKSDDYLTRRILTPALSATYHYRLLKWLSVGGYISYSAAFSEGKNIITGKNFAYQDHFLAIAPSIRFSFLNRKYVSLYAGLAVGITYQFSTDNDNAGVNYQILGQATAFGISVGKKWFGFTEVGFGNKGIVTAGFGYRFDNK